jgi:hypothetical protein
MNFSVIRVGNLLSLSLSLFFKELIVTSLHHSMSNNLCVNILFVKI